MYDFIKTYENPNKFNEEIITGLRQKDEMLEYLLDICNALANTVPYVTFDGYDIEEDESKFSKKQHINIKYSRLSLITFYFTITINDEVEKIKMPIFIPKLINNYYFYLNGNTYYAIYQHVDDSTYNTRDSVILKSLLMPIILKSSIKDITDIDGNVYSVKIYQLNLFKKKANILHYYLSDRQWTKTLEYFGFKDDVEFKILQDKETLSTPEENELYFQITKLVYLKVNKEKFEESKLFKSFVGCIIDLMNKKTQFDKLDDEEYWKSKLGSIFTKNANNQISKADSVLLSFRRILDNRTKKNLRINESDKEDIFSLIKWMMNNFEDLLRKDNLSLLNKRLRLSEYQVNSFNRKVSNNTYRILNSKTLTMTKLKSCFSIPSTIIIQDLQTSELLRYNNAVNDMSLFNTALRYSNRGPSSISDGGRKTVPISYRGIHISHLGRLSLNNLSNGDPGMSGSMSPFVNTDGMYYKFLEEDNDDFEILEEDLEDIEEDTE